MTTRFNEISRTVGQIEGKLDSFMDQTCRDMKAIRDDLKTVVGNLSNLPPSPACREQHTILSKDINELKIGNAKKAGFVGGLAATGTVAIETLLRKMGVI